MDPIGFALESYDAIGRYRTKDGDFPVDSAGKMPNGQEFQNAAEMKQQLRAAPEEFVYCFTERLLTYALGRGVERTDKPVVRAIAREAQANGYPMSSIVLGVVRSAPFQMRRAPGLETKDNSKRGARAAD
jgi:hypothetical protein